MEVEPSGTASLTGRGRLLSGPRPYCPFLPGTEEQCVILYTWRAGPFSFLSRANLTIAPPSRARAGDSSRARDRRGRVDALRWLPCVWLARRSGTSALLLGAALLCRPPLRVSDVHRQPTRPVLKHGPRSPGRSRVVGAHLRTPEA